MNLCTSFLGCHPNNQKIFAQDEDLIYWECQDCGIIWRDKESFHLEKSYNQDYFDSKNYQKNRVHKIEKSGWLLEMVRNIRPGLTSMLEVGCSLGNTLEAAKVRGLNHLGIDVSEFAVNYCINQGLNATTQSLNDLLKEKRDFQLIFMQHVLEHFKNPFEVLSQCGQLLEPRGLVMILIPNSNYARSRRLREDHKFYSKLGVGLEHYVYFNYSNLERVLNRTGFKVVQSNYPIQLVTADHPKSYLNRLARRSMSLFHLDQELVVMAEKMHVDGIPVAQKD